jgi:hypothetical protein
VEGLPPADVEVNRARELCEPLRRDSFVVVGNYRRKVGSAAKLYEVTGRDSCLKGRRSSAVRSAPVMAL